MEKKCKNKWNNFSFNCTKVTNYHAGIDHHILVWDLRIEECDHNHLLKQFNEESYNPIQAF
jgi:hypothetical protein